MLQSGVLFFTRRNLTAIFLLPDLRAEICRKNFFQPFSAPKSAGDSLPGALPCGNWAGEIIPSIYHVEICRKKFFRRFSARKLGRVFFRQADAAARSDVFPGRGRAGEGRRPNRKIMGGQKKICLTLIYFVILRFQIIKAWSFAHSIC